MKIWRKYGLVTCAFFLLAMVLDGKEEQNLNEVVCQAVGSMPMGGGYATTPTSFKNLHQALSIKKGSLVVQPSIATPSFCSEATYLVFLKTIQNLQEQKKLFLHEEQLTALLPHHESDGHGFWGCWNANGPGVARLFYLWGLGSNFTNLSFAQPGDFLKIFWTDAIGSSEHGHSVIYLGTEKKGGVTYLNCWSSNKPDGYGKRSYPLSKMHHLIFSRLQNPTSIERSIALTKKDPYLASLLFHPTTWDEVKRLCGIRVNPDIAY
ncbi:MAG: hypothetical protein DVB29_01410 [Verrucomicrobia bacterium]|nr:MAG: hypothetical protein DVB29_01410 [Verrucomicrobiota bacterium]MDH4470567.1 hypothetical protein [Verrucomicrobiae bacterium]